MVFSRVQVGEILYIYDESNKEGVVKKVRRGLLNGETIQLPDGSCEWFDDRVVFDSTKEGSGSRAYQWDSTGNKVKYNRFHIRLSDGQLTERKICSVFKKLS